VFQAGTTPAFMTKPPTRPKQIIDLLRHTSGLTYGFQQRTNVDAAYRDKQIGTLDPAGTLDSMIAGLADIPLEFSPGEAWNYSVSTDVIGYLVGKISGIPFEQFLKEAFLIRWEWPTPTSSCRPTRRNGSRPATMRRSAA
jgi:CubicO group peptidase (beta-lactamase class C family)